MTGWIIFYSIVAVVWFIITTASYNVHLSHLSESDRKENAKNALAAKKYRRFTLVWPTVFVYWIFLVVLKHRNWRLTQEALAARIVADDPDLPPARPKRRIDYY